jgi:hypothetical protein
MSNFIPLPNLGRLLMVNEPKRVFFKFSRLLKIENTGEH